MLTPGMMSLGVPGLMAVASNMCHKFPKALVGAMKRARYGQVDVKLGIVLGISAEAGEFETAREFLREERPQAQRAVKKQDRQIKRA